MARMHPRHAQRLRRKRRVRKKIRGTTARPRLVVYRSNRHMYAQVIDDTAHRTLVAASTLEDGIDTGGNCDAATQVGKAVGERAVAAGIAEVVFDRNGNLFHGRVKALADAARDAGLKF
ncbi:MAG: 50S ribosomal protein L18 [Acidimicrobiia bacterium]|nr:50S ribosomal protein L18 [Acidimicrobiia bacterium]